MSDVRPENKEAHTLDEKIKRPHRATPLRGGIYPVVGSIIGAVALIALVIYFI